MNITEEGKLQEAKELMELAQKLFGHTKPLTQKEADLLDETFKNQLKNKPYTI